MMFVVGATTCMRAKQYWPRTWASLNEAGFEGFETFMDRHPRLGPKPNFKRCLCDLCFRKRDEPFVVVFQDDILVAKGLRPWLEMNIPREGIVSLYTSSPHDGPDGWQQVDLNPSDERPQPWRHCLGACAIAMPREVAMLYLENDPQFERTDRIGSSLGQFCHRQGLPFWVHNPSLVQHIGVVSCRRGFPMTAERQAKRFCEDVSQLTTGKTA